MKILMVLETKFPPDLRVENEIDALLDKGHDVTIIAGFRQRLERESSYGKAKVIREYIPTFIYKSSIGCLSYPFYFNFWAKLIKNELSSNKYDAVHIHDLPLTKVIVELKKQHNYNFKITLDLHENYPDMLKIAKHTNSLIGKRFFNYQQWLDYEKAMVNSVDNVITVVEEMKQRIIKLGLAKEKVTVVSNTFNAKKFTPVPLNQSKDNFILFYGGGITIDRGLQYVIPALSRIEKVIPNLKLRIVGDGSYLEFLRGLAKEEKAQHLVEFLGYQKFNKLLEYLAESHIALVPHVKSAQTESGLPHKLFQYMVTGIPVVASNCGPFVRILEPKTAGKIYTYDSSKEFSEIIVELYRNPQIRQDLAQNAKELVQAEYLWEYDAERLSEIYKMT